MTAPFWRRRLVPLVLGLLGTNLAVLAGWTGPQGYKQRNAAARAETARAEVERQKEAVSALRERAEAIRSNQKDLERFYGSLAGTEKADLLPTLEAIQEMARSPGLKPGARTVNRDDVRDAPLERVTVTLPLEGSYGQLVGFLREVEHSPRFLAVDRVAMRSDERRGTSLQVELSTYLRLPKDARKEGRRGPS